MRLVMARRQNVLSICTLALTLSYTLVDSIDPFDLSFLTKGAAIGDSYAAGTGSGNRLNWACSRYDGSYANLVVGELGVDPKNMDFTYTACSGAVINEVGDQADKLSGDQQFIIISAGGNDAYLVDILNLCVYSFWNPSFLTSNCDSKLAESADKIKSSQFASDLDNLMSRAKAKLSTGDITLDTRSSLTPLTIPDNSDQDLEDEVDEYEKTMLSSRRDLDAATPPLLPVISSGDFHRRYTRTEKRGNVVPVGSWNKSLDVPSQFDRLGASAMSPGSLQLATNYYASHIASPSGVATPFPTAPAYAGQGIQSMLYPVGTMISLGDVSNVTLSHAAYASNVSRSYNSSTAVMPRGLIIANRTHVLLAQDRVRLKSAILKLIVSDDTARVFHPTQGGHLLIANLILYRMAANNAKAHGITDFPPEVVNSTVADWPQIGGTACVAESSDTWSSRVPMTDALNSFCADPHNVRGSRGTLTSATFSQNTLDYMNVSIMWNTNGVIGEHSCAAWLDVVTDGCSVPIAGSNAQNMKHGGTIAYHSDIVNATLTIEPLVMRRIWDKGQAGGQQCTSVSTHNYLDQMTLQQNVIDYCKASAAQPDGIAVSGSTFSKTFNDGTTDGVSISTTWPRGPRNYQIFEEECLYYLGVLTNGCSLPENANPMNWKHGGTISDNNGVKYAINPTVTRQAPPAKPYGLCSVARQGWGYSWSILGVGFANSDWGAELLTQIRATCRNVVWDWTFNYTPGDSNGYDWRASGSFSLLVSSTCLADAVKNAGGSASNC